MTTRIYGFTALTGGGTGSLDKYPEAGMPALATDDYAFGHVDGAFYLYWFDGASSEAESPPDVIAPNSGSGRWILKSFSSNHNDLMNIDGGNASPEEYYHLASALYNVINSATAQSIIANPTGGATSVTNVTVAEQTLVGRITGGNVDGLSISQVRTLIGAFPSGTKMLFYQNTAPTGWTLDNTLDDKVVYITKGSGAGGQTGGGAHSSGTWTQPNHVHTTGDFTLTTDEMPSHRHGIGYTVSATSSGGTVYGASTNVNATSTYTGGGKAHNHGNTGNGATANTWRPAAYCCIICSKD